MDASWTSRDHLLVLFAALDAMRKAYEEELQHERVKYRECLTTMYNEDFVNEIRRRHESVIVFLWLLHVLLSLLCSVHLFDSYCNILLFYSRVNKLMTCGRVDNVDMRDRYCDVAELLILRCVVELIMLRCVVEPVMLKYVIELIMC